MNRFVVNKKSNTYADSLEAYGLCNLLHKILAQLNENDVDIVIRDYYAYYEITLTKQEQLYSLTEEQLDGLEYFQLFKFVRQKEDTDVRSIDDFYDYARIKKDIDAIKKSEKAGQLSKQESARAQKEKRDEIGPNYYVVQLMAGNYFKNLSTLFLHFHLNKENFVNGIKCILSNYSMDKKQKLEFPTTKSTKVQLYNPSCGKGSNSNKAMYNNENINSEWIVSTLQISGAQSDMVCKCIDKDYKISVPAFIEIKYSAKEKVIDAFYKKNKGGGSIQSDILNALCLTETLLLHDGLTVNRRKIRSVVSGLQVAYQKNLGKQNGITNICFIGLPEFITVSSRKENNSWLKYVQEQINVVQNLAEKKHYDGLALYRDFLSDSSVNNFHAFTFWYARYSMSQLYKQKYVQSISKTSLNQLYSNMEAKDLNLEEIVKNEGLQAVADAIRKSTVSLQRIEKSKRKYEIRYGLAQKLQIASNSKEDLATFVADFAMTYNAETARVYERDHKDNPEKDSRDSGWIRTPIAKNELESFYQLLSAYPPKLIGGLLGAYGFASNENNKSNNTTSSITNK